MSGNPNGNGGGAPAPSAPTPAPSTVQHPAPAPAPAPAPQPQAPLSYIDDAYNNMLADDLPAERDTWGPPASTPTPAPPAPQYPQPVVLPGQTPPTPPPQAQPQPQPVAPPPQPSVAPQAPVDPSQAAMAERVRRDPFGAQADLIEQQTQQYVDALATQVYPVSQEDIDAFVSGDGKRVSQALARVHVNSVGSMLRVVSQQMPVWINSMLQLHSAARSREDQFWQRNSFLDRTKHEAAALNVARAYRQMYPQATDDVIDRMVGAMVAVASGIQVPAGHAQGVAPQAPQQPPAAPIQTPYRTPGPVVRRVQQPFQPAGTAVAGGASPRAATGGQWSELAEILLADQAGKLDNVT